MSKNITIQEGGVGKQFTADKLKTDLTAGGDTKWVPEDNYNLTAKQITEDGTYVAASEGYYGYSEVTASGFGRVSGKGQDGNEHMITTDSIGNLVDTILPSYIEVVVPPTVTTYQDGATISFSGMTVKAYDGEGNIWTGGGSYPDGDVTASVMTPVTTADASQIENAVWGAPEGTYEVGNVSISGPLVAKQVGPVSKDGVHVNFQSASRNAWARGTRDGQSIVWCNINSGNNYAILVARNSDGQILQASDESFSFGMNSIGDWEGRNEIDGISPQSPSTYTYNGKKVYYGFGNNVGGGTLDEWLVGSTPALDSANAAQIAWYLVYGDAMSMIGGGQKIPVEWTRPDGVVLESYFWIHFSA